MDTNKPFNFYGDIIASNYENQRQSDSWWIWEDKRLADFLSSINENEYILDAPSGTGRTLNLPLYMAADKKSVKFQSFFP